MNRNETPGGATDRRDSSLGELAASRGLRVERRYWIAWLAAIAAIVLVVVAPVGLGLIAASVLLVGAVLVTWRGYRDHPISPAEAQILGGSGPLLTDWVMRALIVGLFVAARVRPVGRS